MKNERKDFRNITTFTIDPDNAKDFDDALSFRLMKDGTYEIGVHIADVSAFVKEGSAIDKEAYQRATSVYLVDRVIPMLPEELSNNLCSLMPKEDRLAFAVIFIINDQAEVLSYQITETLINSDRRFTYNDVQAIIEDAKSSKGDFKQEILHLWSVAKKLRDERFATGAINFASEEVKFILDEEKHPVDVTVYELKEANFLVEEFMLLANKTVAKHIGDKKDKKDRKTFVYRVHDVPDEEKMALFKTFTKTNGYILNDSSRLMLSKSLNNLFKATKNTPNSLLYSSIALRTMSKAVYSTSNIGHYGLGFRFYSHFTSPIRRYPDLMAHRLLKKYIRGEASVNATTLEQMCEHCSQMEKQAEMAERASIKFKQAEFLLDKVGKTFCGVVSGVTKFGIFVLLEENKCEGLVNMESIKDDYYFYDEKKYAVIGKRHKKEYHIGVRVSVKVKNVNLIKREIDFCELKPL